MPTSLAKGFVILEVVGFALYWWALVGSRVPRKDWRRLVFLPPCIMGLALGVNALAVLQVTTTHWIELSQSESMSQDGVLVRSSIGLVDLLKQQLGVILGTGSLLSIITKALRTLQGAEVESWTDAPHLLSLQVQLRIYGPMLRRFWWAVLGVTTVFGAISGPGLALFLLVELLIMWISARIAMNLLIRKRDRTREQG